MARMGPPLGNSNAAKGKKFRQALNKALREDPQRLFRIAKKLLVEAEGGAPWAVTEVINRLDGKAVTPIDMDVSMNPSIAEQFERARARLEAENRGKGLREVKTVDGETILVEGNGRAVTPEFAKLLLEKIEQHRNPEKVIEGEATPALEHQPASRNNFDSGRLDALTSGDAPPRQAKTMSFIEAMGCLKQEREVDDECDLA